MTFNPRAPFRELGGQPKGQAAYVEQNGIVFVWSESNIDYTPILERKTGIRLLPDALYERVIQRDGYIPS